MATAALIAKFKAAYPEIVRGNSTWADTVYGGWLDRAAEIHIVSERAHMACAAHMIALADEEIGSDDVADVDGGGGLTTGEQIGSHQASYQHGDMTAQQAWFARTPYGREYLMLIQRERPGLSVRVL